ncbi:hypothetical protein [Larkinella soli]|uniref:hypothetical protein n=1 Tax=Larkinella soli TaxID=1770527 RepID=UPI000FFB241F|nr:hypothetical protein [Larkinella soli]
MKKLLLSISTVLGLASSLYAQDMDSLRSQLNEARKNRYPSRIAQVGFVPPLSTNGLENARVSNHLSINLLGGYAAALDGVEFSGLFSLEKDYAKGAQFSGIFNGVRNELDGAQFGGIANAVGGSAFGAQFAGISNTVGGPMKGAQFAGIANVVGKQARGLQVAGIANVAYSIDGVQIAGIANVAKRVRGTQIGLINVAETVEGAQIGLLSIARNGYRRFEVWAGDALYANMGLKMGGNTKFYNILAVGATFPTGDKTRWGYGYGIGTNQPLGKRNQLSIEGIAYQIHEEGTSWDYLNMLNQVRLSFIFPIHNRLALTVTPTFNVQVTDLETGEGIGTKWVKWDVYDRTFNDRTRVRMWPGLNVGIQF